MKAFRKKYHQVIQTRTGNTAPLLLTSVKKNKRKVGHSVAEWVTAWRSGSRAAEWVPRGGVDPARRSGSRAAEWIPAAAAPASVGPGLPLPPPALRLGLQRLSERLSPLYSAPCLCDTPSP